MSSTDNTELILAIVALIISVLAFVIAILQALQQYFASATGFSSCSEAVIGKWSQFSKRRLLWSEFRFEVQFETPVIFVAKPDNTRGPLGNDEDFSQEHRKIIRLDGSHANLRYTSSTEEFNEQQKKSKQQAVHTADNENATWCHLLMTIYQMEKDSLSWQKESLGYHPPCDPSPPHSLVVCMQRKRRVWDSMPQGLSKPYATTTISHLVEIAAMIGIHWKNFDLNNDRYRAQGNGFVLYGSYVDNLGITFTFQKQGPTLFGQNRVIPTHDIKKLCFGLVPTILHQEKLVDFDDRKDNVNLQLGSFAEIADTLAAFGCDTNTVNYFRKNPEHARHSHLFPKLLAWDDQNTENTERPLNGSINTDLGCVPPADKIIHLRSGIELCDRYLNEVDMAMVYQIVRVHVQEILGMLNKPSPKETADALIGPRSEDESDSSITISHIDSASGDDKHHLLAEMYFSCVRLNVIDAICKQWSQFNQKATTQVSTTEGDSELALKRKINQIWCTLMFRMLYWLQLHDFHKKDIQISKGDAYDSRIPVYIL
ncbi:hypothetical protein TARUN_2811 [Trichoderma arundinaceum]|uniref:Modin n=1 Tax=Trichoderma arundinaceum TaxID=490622 RepID=A0A395NTL7_TRIAR|nr:hypothetical protein TARUN_2811 [Trichoderma arundinaceum]